MLRERISESTVSKLFLAILFALVLVLVPHPALAEEEAAQEEEQAAIVEESTPAASAVAAEAAPSVEAQSTESAQTSDAQSAVETTQEEPVDAQEEETIQTDEEDETAQTVEGDSAEATEEGAQTTISAAPEEAQPNVAEGNYVIETAVSDPQVLDVTGGKTANKTNVQTYKSNMSAAQQWELIFEKAKEAYRIALKGTSGKKVLDVSGGKAVAGTNVQIYDWNKSNAQLWTLIDKGNGAYQIASALGNNLVLDVAGGKKTNGTNICVYTANGTKAQLFYLLPVNPEVEGNATDEYSGLYNVLSASKSSYALDINGASLKNSANAQIYTKNDTGAQKYYFEYDGKGFYTVTVIGSGKVLDVAGANLVPGTNVQQYTRNNTDAQKWAVRKNSNGALSLINKATGLLLDIAGAKFANGTNVLGYRDNGTEAQQFKLKKTEFLNEGIYAIRAFSNTNQVLDVKGASTASGAPIQMYQSNNSLAQRYQVVRLGENTYRIRAAASGRWVANNPDDNGEFTVQKGDSTTDTTKPSTWYAVWNGSYFSLKNNRTGQVLELVGGKTANGTQLHTAAANKTHKQHFIFTQENLITPGLYEIKSKLGTTLDVAGASEAAGANIDAYKVNNTNAQKFYLEKKNGYWIIKSYVSDKVVAISGSNAQQVAYTGAKAQLWIPVIQDGGYIGFANVANSTVKNNFIQYADMDEALVLDINGGSAKSGANVQGHKSNESKAQHWKLVPTKGNPYWKKINGKWNFFYSDGSSKVWSNTCYNAWKRINSKASSTKYLCAIDNSACHTFIFKGSKGKWEPLKDYLCDVGTTSATDPTFGITFRGESSISKKGYKMGYCPYEYYWTEFYNKVVDEHGEGQRFHSILYWGKAGGSVYDGRLGMQITHGCVRLSLEASKFIYDSIPLGTKVVSY